MDPTTIQTAWYVLLGAVWVIYLVFGGTDLGIGQLVRRTDRATALRSIGPTWGANDVWLIIAVAITLGAFPGWYASLMSGAYVPLIGLVSAIMLRHAGMELVGHSTPKAQPRWERVIVATSIAIPVLWGLIWAGALDGSLAAGNGDAGLGLLTPTGLLAGLALAALCRVQGIAFLRLRVPQTRGELSLRRPSAVAGALIVAAALVLSGTAVQGLALGAVGTTFAVIAIGGLAFLARGIARQGEGTALLGAAATMTGIVGAVLAVLWRTPIAGAGPQAVQLSQAASGATTLNAMLAISIVLLPMLLTVMAFAYVRFLRPPAGAPARGLGALLASAARGTLRELR